MITIYHKPSCSTSRQVLEMLKEHTQDIEIIDGMALVIPSKIRLVLAGEKDIAEAIRKYYGVGAETIDQMMDSTEVKTRVGMADADQDATLGEPRDGFGRHSFGGDGDLDLFAA